MGLQDIFTKRDSAGATPGSASANVMSGEQAEQARLRARRRLIGAVVLLGIGVIAFPLLFETQPRPIAVDIPIVIPPRDGVPPLALPAPKPVAQPAASAPVTAAPAASSAETAPVGAVPASPTNAAAATSPKPVVKASEPAAPPKPAVTVAPAPAPAPVAKPAAEPAKPAAPAAGRFVVQIGAFAETAAVREARSKARKAGLTTFTQTVDTADGKRTRVRVGPFASREEAEKAAAQAKAAGLGGSVLTL